jgi:aminopeptidase
VVFLQVPECAKPILLSLRRAVLKAGAHPIIEYLPDGISREYYELANEEHLNFFPKHYLLGKVKQADHFIMIIAETDKKELEGIHPEKIMKKQKSWKPYSDWRDKKENEGKFTWTLGLYGTEAMAKEAGMTLKQYWNEIIKACYLDDKNPIDKWKKAINEVERVRRKLDALKIEKLHVKSKDTDLIVKIGKGRKWLGGSGRNIPSFEVFISPDWRGTSGKVYFNKPLYRYGNLIEEVWLEFESGVVVKSRAKKGEKVLRGMIDVKNADKIGEFSLTDSRLSKITKFMAETLFDENVGGKNGNMHLALGKAYRDSYTGNPGKVSKKKWEKLGYNDSVIHTDIVSTENRVVTAELRNGKKIVIYKNGKFVI